MGTAPTNTECYSWIFLSHSDIESLILLFYKDEEVGPEGLNTVCQVRTRCFVSCILADCLIHNTTLTTAAPTGNTVHMISTFGWRVIKEHLMFQWKSWLQVCKHDFKKQLK